MTSCRSVNHLAPCILSVSLLTVAIAEADQNFAGFRHIDTSGEPPGAMQAAPNWGPVQTDKASIANLSPVLLPFFNNGPVFGLPGTVVGDFWQNTQLTGDWGGFRTSLAKHGIFFDLYSTTAYQDVASGGLKTGSSFVENIQLSINIDTGRAGLWPGGLFHFTVGSRFGDSAKNTFTVGSSTPQNTGLAFPGPFFDADVYPPGYFRTRSAVCRASLSRNTIGPTSRRSTWSHLSVHCPWHRFQARLAFFWAILRMKSSRLITSRLPGVRSRTFRSTST